MEMLVLLIKEMHNDLQDVEEGLCCDDTARHGDTQRAHDALIGLHALLEHIGLKLSTQASTYGDQTPLMRLCDEPKRSSSQEKRRGPARGPVRLPGGGKGGGQEDGEALPSELRDGWWRH